MKGILTLSILLLAAFVNAQKIPVIGGGQFDKSFYKDVRQEMSYSLRNGGSDNEIGSFVFETRMKENRLHVYTSLRLFNSTDTWIDTSIADGQTFQPVYRSSSTPAGEMVLNYEKEITGFYYDRKTKKKTAIREPGQSIFFDSYAYPYLLGLLPLTSGYKSEIAIYDYKQGSERNIKKCRIEEVKSNVFVSSLTGEHKTWQVDVLEEASNDRYIYYFDKDSRRLWKIEIFSRGQHIVLADRESDYNPFTAAFDKEETLKLIKSGTATITGKVFARDNQNSGMLKGMAVLNVNKKQYARKGTSILLIPYTAYFKEWVKLNESLRKKGQAIPLPKRRPVVSRSLLSTMTKGHLNLPT